MQGDLAEKEKSDPEAIISGGKNTISLQDWGQAMAGLSW